MRVNITKKNIINSIYMQIGFSKKISENLLEDLLILLINNLKQNKKIKISNFGTFTLRNKQSRIGRNPLTREKKTISKRNVILFKPSKEFKSFINLTKNE
tara:strand:- start:421 stop:720 length:300 start_codon:yes stop_codon:yes gene_type:complete